MKSSPQTVVQSLYIEGPDWGPVIGTTTQENNVLFSRLLRGLQSGGLLVPHSGAMDGTVMDPFGFDNYEKDPTIYVSSTMEVYRHPEFSVLKFH